MFSENIVRSGWVTMNYFVDDFQGFSYCDYLAIKRVGLPEGWSADGEMVADRKRFVDDTTQFKISFPFKQYFSIIIFLFPENKNRILQKIFFFAFI